MFCQYCGRQIDEAADVCVGCGKLLHSGESTKTKQRRDGNRLFNLLSIFNLIFCSMFFCVGVMLLLESGIDILEGTAYYNERWIRYDIYIFTNGFASFLVSVISGSTGMIISMILLAINNRKVINIISLGLSTTLIMLMGIITFFAGV